MRTRDRPGSLTEHAALPTATGVVDRDGYRLVRTEERPDFRAGNLLELDAPPAAGELGSWLARCAAEHAGPPTPDEWVLAWESGLDAAPLPALPGEARVERSTVLLLAGPAPAGLPPDGVTLRPLVHAGDWAALAALDIEELGAGAGPSYADFVRWQISGLAPLVARGLATWWGAYAGDGLVGSAGLVERGPFLGLHDVVVRAASRRRGVCSALLARAIAAARTRRPGAPCALMTDAGSDAERLYRALGFCPVGVHVQVRLARPGVRAAHPPVGGVR